MAYSEALAERVRRSLTDKHILFFEKKMMGGLCFLVDEKMCVGIIKDKLMARIDPTEYPGALTRQGCHQMDFTGRPMKGFVFVDNTGTDMEDDLDYWIDLCLDFNPRAVASKKR